MALLMWGNQMIKVKQALAAVLLAWGALAGPGVHAAATQVYQQPQWNIPDTAHQGFVPPTVKQSPTNPVSPPAEHYNLLAVPLSYKPATRLAPLPNTPQPVAPQNTVAQPGQLTTQGSLWVLAVPGSRTEHLFADIPTRLQGDMITVLNATGQAAQPLIWNPATQDWLEDYLHTRQLSPYPQAGQPLLLIESTMDNHHTREPGTPLGWFRWMVTDTMPSSMQYRLVVTAQLIDTATGKRLWQGQQTVTLRNQQLTSLNSRVARVPGNQWALAQASQQACQALAAQVRLATGQTTPAGYFKNRGLATLKQLPATLRQQFAP
jgi:hypothetical protein